MAPSDHRLDYTAFGQETCSELGKGLQLRSQYDDVSVHVRLLPARRWRRGTDRDPSCRLNHTALRWAVKNDSLCEAYAKHLVDSDLPLDDWYGSFSKLRHIISVSSQHHRVVIG